MDAVDRNLPVAVIHLEGDGNATLVVRDAQARLQVIPEPSALRKQGQAFAVIHDAVCKTDGNERHAFAGNVVFDRFDLPERLPIKANYVAQPR
jgi:hypothetical protein